MRALIVAAVVAGLAGTAAQPAVAAGFVGLLKGGPVELFDDADLHLFLETARNTLEGGVENQPLTWQNPKTGHGGDMTVVKRFENKGRPCTRVRVRNQAEGRRSTMQHNVCVVDGRWRLIGNVKPGEAK